MDSPIGLSEKTVEQLYALSDALKKSQINAYESIKKESENRLAELQKGSRAKSYSNLRGYTEMALQAEALMEAVDSLSGRHVSPPEIMPSLTFPKVAIERIDRLLEHATQFPALAASNTVRDLNEGSSLHEALSRKKEELQKTLHADQEKARKKSSWGSWLGGRS